MHETNHVPPERMPPEQRRHEVAFLLAQGLVRLREAGLYKSAKGAQGSAFALGFGSQKSVHNDTVNNEITESK